MYVAWSAGALCRDPRGYAGTERERTVLEGPSKAALARGELALVHQRVLGEYLYLYCWARFVVVAGILSAALLGKYVLGFPDLNMLGLISLAAALAAYNTVLLWVVAPRRDPDDADAQARVLVAAHHSMVVLDFVALTLVLWLIGGAGSPFQAVYLLHIMLSAMLLSSRAAWMHTILGFALFTTLVVLEWQALIPCWHPLGHSMAIDRAAPRFVGTVLVVQGALMTLTAFLATGIVRQLRSGERKLQRARDELDSLSRLRRDFLHIALHDLKAPIGAVRSVLAAIKSGYGGPVTDEQKQWIDRCLDRLSGLSLFLRDLGVLAELDAQTLRERASPVDLGSLVRSLVKENEDLARVRGQTITAEVDDALPPVIGQERLLREAILNYITNAVRYTPMGKSIAVRALRCDGGVRVEVQDEGVGISADDQAKLFVEFSRVRQKGAGRDASSSSGLGLSIVKRIVLMHGGRVGCSSVPGEGSTFFAEFPREN